MTLGFIRNGLLDYFISQEVPDDFVELAENLDFASSYVFQQVQEALFCAINSGSCVQSAYS